MTHCRICGCLGNADETFGERIICEDCADQIPLPRRPRVPRAQPCISVIDARDAYLRQPAVIIPQYERGDL